MNNTIKQLPNLEEITIQQANCIKGGLTDTRNNGGKLTRGVPTPVPPVK